MSMTGMKVDTLWTDMKSRFVYLGSVVLLAAGLGLVWCARQHQVSGQPMPNGHGGVMTCRDGYLISAVLFLVSAAWWLSGRRLRRGRRADAANMARQ